MSKWTDAPIVGGTYSDDTRPFSVQDTINLLPVMAECEGTRSISMLRGVPGFEGYVDLGTNAPLRGAHNAEGLLLVVSGTTLFKINPNATKTALGTIPGVGRVSMAHNQVAGGNQVAIANGQSGYVYDTAKGTLTQITDDGFPGALSFDFVDGYITGIDPGRNFAYTSDLADATSYNTLDRYEAEGSPDKLVGQIVDHREWWLFGERTIEPYVNQGTETGTFQRASGTVIDVGAASPHAIVKMDNSVFWLGSDGLVYRANGYTPVRISTFPIEQAISRCTRSSAFAFTYEDRGHKIFYLTFQDGQTWGYDVSSQLWHRRQSKNLNRWRINTLTQWNGMWLAGDFSNGKLYRMDWDIQSEDGATLERRRITGVLSDSENPIIVNAVKLVIDTGNPSNTPISHSGGVNPGVDEIKYLVVPRADTADYSGFTVDDSQWAKGLAPFANQSNEYAPQVGFPADPKTNWGLGTNLWYRAHPVLSRTADVQVKVFADDGCTFWINGVQVFDFATSGTGPVDAYTFYREFTIAKSLLVDGPNLLAVKSRELYGQLSYFYFEATQTS